MALNFGEVFLRESGAAQDRAQSMTEMQLRAKQFADDLAYREAQLQFSKEVQSFNEEEARFQRVQQFLNRSQQNRQFQDEMAYKREALAQQKDISDDDRAAEMKKLDVQKEQFEAENNIAWANLDQNERQMLLDYGIKTEDLGIRKELAKAGIEETKARTAATTGAEERAQDMAPLEQALTQRQIQAGAIANALNSLQLARETRGEAYATEQTSDETKRLLGLSPEDDLTNERAGNLLQTRILEEGLREKELTRESATAQQIYMERPQKSLEEAVESVKSGRYSALDKKSGFGRYVFNPAMNLLSGALGGPANTFSENAIMRRLETGTGIKKRALIDALMEKSSEGSIVPGMPLDLRKIYEAQARLNILRSVPEQTNISASTMLGPNYPNYGADYSNYIQMTMGSQEELMPGE